jgi:hypothetical protein
VPKRSANALNKWQMHDARLKEVIYSFLSIIIAGVLVKNLN